jgi:hypothetical protein
MSDEKSSSRAEWSRILDDAWPAVAPPSGFAGRVLERLAAPERVQLRSVPLASAKERRAFRSTFVVAAVAVAVLVILPLAVLRRSSPARAATVAVGVAPDLGLERD